MNDIQVFYERSDSDYGEGILLEVFNGSFRLINAQRSRKAEGTIYKKWVFPQGKDKKPLEKNGNLVSVPWQIELGNQREAINVLKYFLEAVSGREVMDAAEDVPF